MTLLRMIGMLLTSLSLLAGVTGVCWVVVLTVVTFAAFRWDKGQACRYGRRVPERVLLALAAAGGSVGALGGMYLAGSRHKVGKPQFVRRVWRSLLWWVLGAVVLGGSLMVGVALWLVGA